MGGGEVWVRIIFIFLLSQIGFVFSIILKNVTIPPYGVKDGRVELGCDFALESDTLLVLKWYRDEKEFFRFSPNAAKGHILTFPVHGVFVDLSKSTPDKVVLRNITLQTSGVYKCEVSVDFSFRTVSKQGYMVIIAPPQSEPVISGVHSAVNTGDMVTGNCTSYRSKPPAELYFYVNNEKAEVPEITKYPLVQESDGLETSTIGFNFLVENRHFQNGVLSLRCTATIGNFYWIKNKNISNAHIEAQLSYQEHNKFLPSGGPHNHQFSLLLYFMLIIAMFMSIYFWLL